MNLNAYLYRQLIGKHWFETTDDPKSFEECEQYLDKKIESIPEGKSFIFLTDPHRREGKGNVMNSPAIIGYICSMTGIKTVLLGGDYVGREKTKYLAIQEMESYLNEMKAISGKNLIVVMGNHDINTANVPKEDCDTCIIPYKEVENTLMRHIDRVCEDISEKIEYLNCTQEVREELLSYSRLHYYIDDDELKIRYIILNTGCPTSGNCVFDAFGVTQFDELILQFDWLYETLKSVPRDYDVVIAGHYLYLWFAEKLAPVTVELCKIVSGFRTKSRVTVNNIFSDNEKVTKYYSAGEHIYDFTDSKASGNAVILGGDTHWDTQEKADYNDNGEFVSVPYNGEKLSDTAVVVSGLQSDAYGCVNYYEKTFKMEPGTNTEQCFDIVTICPDGNIKMTRIGAGVDRIINVSGDMNPQK